MEDHTPINKEEDSEERVSADELLAQPPAASPEEELTAKCAEYKAAWQRALADYDNLKKDTERQRGEFAKFACADLIIQLLPTVEALRHAAAHEPKPAEGAAAYPPEVSQWIQGVAAIRAQLDAALKKAGVEPIDQAGVPFDPSVHEAMLTKPVEGVEAGQVVEVLEAGCRLHDRVIRPAKVSVSE